MPNTKDHVHEEVEIEFCIFLQSIQNSGLNRKKVIRSLVFLFSVYISETLRDSIYRGDKKDA